MSPSRLVGFAVIALLAGPSAGQAGQAPSRAQARAVKVIILSTMLADRGIGEWGFAALLEVDGRRLLFDTGARPETVLRNSQELGVDLTQVTDAVLTHNHDDHTTGLVTLRRELMKKNPNALSRVHVATGIFASRVDAKGDERNGLIGFRADYEATAGRFVEHREPTEIIPGVWFTGPVPRTHPERNYGAGLRVKTAAGTAEDTVSEDSSVFVDTPEGLVLITGCGHAGIVNISEYAIGLRPSSSVHAVIGGLHLFAASDDHLTWTGQKLKDAGVDYLLGAHCTGIEAVFQLRRNMGLSRQTAVVGAVGASFTLGKGIDPLSVAR
jgi:7,8-dihydropterin-6-yl-methyl-4-(beta-D-ribofuranosyl)aminobenzene 5'-phosphate synthase